MRVSWSRCLTGYKVARFLRARAELLGMHQVGFFAQLSRVVQPFVAKVLHPVAASFPQPQLRSRDLVYMRQTLNHTAHRSVSPAKLVIDHFQQTISDAGNRRLTPRLPTSNILLAASQNSS